MKVRFLNNNKLRRAWPGTHLVFGRAAHTGEFFVRIGLFGFVLILKHGGFLKL